MREDLGSLYTPYSRLTSDLYGVLYLRTYCAYILMPTMVIPFLSVFTSSHESFLSTPCDRFLSYAPFLWMNVPFLFAYVASHDHSYLQLSHSSSCSFRSCIIPMDECFAYVFSDISMTVSFLSVLTSSHASFVSMIDSLHFVFIWFCSSSLCSSSTHDFVSTIVLFHFVFISSQKSFLSMMNISFLFLFTSSHHHSYL